MRVRKNLKCSNYHRQNVMRILSYKLTVRLDQHLNQRTQQRAQCREKRSPQLRTESGGLRGWEFCPFSPFFATFSTFTKIPQVPSFQAHSPVKTVFRENPKNARKSQNTPSTNPYQNETQFPSSSLKNATSGHARPPKSVICPPVISGTNSRQNSLKFP